ncbi:MAG: DNA polymerase I [Acidimicrobiaceae bacterium]|nr:DNA polymerase I [Acidimicrobiaceae bacterium]
MDAIDWLHEVGAGPGSRVAVTLAPGAGFGLAIGEHRHAFPDPDPVAAVARIESETGLRWCWWDRSTADVLVAGGVALARCWDVLTVHRLLHGGWRTSIAEVWAGLHDLPLDRLPVEGQLDLLGSGGDDGDAEDPVRPDGHLKPDWIGGGWATTLDRLARWAATADRAARRQDTLIDAAGDPARTRSAAHAESIAEFLCAELSAHGLPFDVAEAERIIGDAVGPRAIDERTEVEARAARDAEVLRHLGPGASYDLRNPAEVKAMLRRASIDVPDTRAWRLERMQDAHPVVPALLRWRKAERIATTYGYRWLDEHVGRAAAGGDRLRGEWTSSDGAAGRMTASAGLHNLPTEMRSAVVADGGYVFVRADLGQIEPRVLAAVSGDPALVAATTEADLYAPVADRLRVTRDVAKVAVLGAMYGATTGESAHALRGLEREYPSAMGFLADAAAAGQRGDDVFTIGGRRVRMWIDDTVDDEGRGDIDRARRVAAARGRFARNAVIQGAAAEFFKVWSIIVRARAAALGGEVVLCLHDELLVHVPADRADDATALVDDALQEAAYRWSPSRDVRFVADTSVITRWSDAK